MSPTTSTRNWRRTTEAVDDPSGIVWRPRVLERLTGATGELVLMAAPAGYGKTSHVRAWSRQDGRPVARIDLDHTFNDVNVFLPIVLGELGAVVGLGIDEILTNTSVTNYNDMLVASRLGQLMRSCVEPFILVLDDAHVLQRAPVTALVRIIAENVPESSTVVIVGRSVGHLELARVKAYSRVVEVGSKDLALDADAAHSLLNRLGVEADDTQVAAIVEHTEGWPLGIRLATLDTQLADEGALAEIGSPGHSDAVAAFVTQEWLDGLPSATSDFLLHTSCLDKLSGPICDALLDRADSGNVLADLHRDSQMLIPLDRSGEWYRVHSLLRDVLSDALARTNRAEQRRLQLRVSALAELAGDIDAAVTQALAADDVARASHLVAQHGPRHHTAGRIATVRRWMSVLGHDAVTASAELSLVAALNAIAVGDLVGGRVWLHTAADRADHDPDGPLVRAQIAAIESLTTTNVDPSTMEQASRAYRSLPPGEWHAVACFAFGVTSFVLGDDDTARSVLVEGSAEACIFGSASLEAQCSAAHAFVLASAGDWSSAEPLARSARALQRLHGLDDRPIMALVPAVSALVEARHGDPKAARADAALARRSIAHLSAGGGRPGLLARIALAEANLVLGDRVAASTLLDEARQLSDSIATTSPVGDLIECLAARLRHGAATLPYGPSALTTAELRVLHYLPTNLTLAKIAELHYISRNTAKSHAAAVYRKLGVNSRSEAVGLARMIGLLPDDGSAATE